MNVTRSLRAADRAAALLPWACLLPAALLVLPGPLALLARDPFPHLAGAGWAVVALLPTGLLLAIAGVRVSRELLLLLAVGALALLSALLGLEDTFEATRAGCQLLALGVLFAAGARLDAKGRNVLALGVVAASCAWTAFALAQSALASDGHLAGVLGDTGSLSQAALPGAVLGAWFAAQRAGVRSVLGWLASVGFLFHAALAPVFAGGLAFSAALVLGALAAPLVRNHRPQRRVLGSLAAACLGGLILGRGLPADPLETGEGAVQAGEVATVDAPADATGELGGVEVRTRIWRRTLAVTAAHPLRGVGPGQFQAAFPVWRDPQEVTLSRGGACEGVRTEVEHAHSDPLQALTELGLPGGLAWLALLVLVAGRAFRSVRGGDPRNCALGLAALAMLSNALVHTPLLANPAAGPLTFALFGALIGPSSAEKPTRWVGVLFVAGLLFTTFPAMRLIRHGTALEEHVAARRLLAENVRDGDAWLDAKRSVERALEIAPDSAEARRLLAHTVRTPDERFAAWEAFREVRPTSVEALEATAVLFAEQGELDSARERLVQALSLSPTDPGVLKNLARLELRDGDPELGLQHFAALRSTGCAEEAWRRGFAADLILRFGRAEAAAQLFFETTLERLSPEQLHAAYQDEESGATDHVRDAYECLAQLLWARQHADRGAFRLALRNYRQAIGRSAAWTDGGAGPIVVELTAAEALAEARRPYLEFELDARTQSELPDWALDAVER